MSTPKRVLIIDDDVDFRAAVRALLASEGYDVVEVSSGHEALAQSGQFRKLSLSLFSVRHGIISSCTRHPGDLIPEPSPSRIEVQRGWDL